MVKYSVFLINPIEYDIRGCSKVLKMLVLIIVLTIWNVRK